MKRRITVIATMVFALLLCSCTANPNPIDKDYSAREGLLEYTVQSGEICINYVNHSVGLIEIPQKINGFAVTQIGDSAFYQNKCVDIKLPSTIRSIQSSAFYRCYNLQDIIIPSETVSIKGNPFFRCSGLKTIHVEQGNPNYCDRDGVLYDAAVKTLIAYPEGRCDSVFEIPEGVTEITAEAFGYTYLRKKKKLSQKKLAQQAGIDVHQLRGIERGRFRSQLPCSQYLSLCKMWGANHIFSPSTAGEVIYA